jgi:PAS domain S-box-containing protein
VPVPYGPRLEHELIATLTNPAQLDVLRAADLLAGERIEAFDRLARAAARATHAPVAQVNLLTADEQLPLACYGPEPWTSAGAVPLDFSYCKHVVGTARPLRVADAREHPLTRDSRATTESGIAAYAAAPLTTDHGHTLGTLCVFDFHPREWTDEHMEILDDLAALAVSEIQARVAARRQTREAVAASEARYRALADDALDTSEVGTIILDAEFRVIWVNRAIERFFDVERVRILGRDKRLLLHEELKHRVEDSDGFERLLRAIYAANDSVAEFECRLKDGRWLAHWSRPIHSGVYAGGRIEHYYDVTEAKRAESVLREHARVAETLHSLGESFASELNLEALVERVTDAATALTGAQFGAFFYNQKNEAGESYTLYTISGVPREAFSKFPNPRNTPVFHPTFAGEGVVRSDDITQDPRYGTMGPHFGMPKGHLPVRSYLAVPVTSSSGEVIGGIFLGHEGAALFSETHERLAVGIASWAAVAVDNARLYDAERRARAAAEEANRAKADFLATMSHELRTPLNATIGYSDLLLMGIPEAIPTASQAQVRRIGASARHLLELIEEILSFSRIEAGRERVDVEEFDVVELAVGVGEMLEPLAGQQGLAFHVGVPDGPVPMRSDARKIRQILLNLLSNAIKFTEAGSVELQVTAREGEMEFVVADTGIGISPEHLARVFEPFYQAETAKHLRVSGTGLGLALVRQVSEMLGGGVSVESTPGQGTRFTVRLPRELPFES